LSLKHWSTRKSQKGNDRQQSTNTPPGFTPHCASVSKMLRPSLREGVSRRAWLQVYYLPRLSRTCRVKRPSFLSKNRTPKPVSEHQTAPEMPFEWQAAPFTTYSGAVSLFPASTFVVARYLPRSSLLG